MQYWTIEMEKQVGERVQRMLDSPRLLKIYQHFGAAPFRRSSVFHGLERFLLDQGVSGDRCFEIGTWNGLTAVILSQFFGEVVTCDIAHNTLRYEIADCVGARNIRFVDLASNAEKKTLADSFDFDFAYLDGDHANDTASDWALVKDCGRVLFHECWPFQKPVWDLVQQLPDDEVVYGGAGLALWRGKE
jgi:SAM-dependent methyltransferase